MHKIVLHWASKTHDPFAQTSATLWVKAKRHQLNDKAASLAKLYGADTVSYGD